MVAIFAAWGQWTFGVVQDAANVPVGDKIHSWTVPAGLCLFYLVSLPVLKALCQRYLWNTVDVRALLTEAMVVYNAGQVLLNGWMVYRIIDSLIYNDHPFIRGTGDLVTTGTTYAVWVHYCDKYLEFMDTYFMVLRGKMDQVRQQYQLRNGCLVKVVQRLLVRNSFCRLTCPYLLFAGFLFTCLSPCVHISGMVVRSLGEPGGRQLLWCSSQLMDSCHDVLVLHIGSFEDCLSVEKVPDTGPAFAVCFGGWLHHRLLHPPAGRYMGNAVPCPTI